MTSFLILAAGGSALGVLIGEALDFLCGDD